LKRSEFKEDKFRNPFSTTWERGHLPFTLVKEGKTTKDIAELLVSTTDVIDFHRKNLRKKLGLKKTKSNLRSYLLFLS